MIPRFRVGQNVYFSGGPYRTAANGLYEVIRQLPAAEGEYQYRIKSAREQHERMVKESELKSAMAA